MSVDELKRAAAEKAVLGVESGMTVGLGTGSTTRFAVVKIGELWQSGQLTDLVAIPTSEDTAALARQYDIPLTTLDEHPVIDLVIDGADEVDCSLNLIKGLGGALLREKMVELAARRFVVIVDEGKLSKRLGLVSPLPVEIVRFGWKYQARWLETLGCDPALRGGEEQPYLTDNGNYILDCTFSDGIADPENIAAQLQARVGVVAHGLFLNMASEVLVASPTGVKRMAR
jgi:ribose 5-phosphate isomerase A